MMRFDSDELTDALRRSWEAGAPAPDSWDVEAALARVKGRDLTAESLELHPARGARGRRIAALVAASIVATVGIGLAVRRLARPVAPQPISTIVSSHGERRAVRLPDGTSVTVGPGSRLEVMASFGKPARVVSVDGDAYFRVAPDPARPFSVVAGRGVIRVIGTEFAVRAYREDSTTRVAVVEGRVTVAPSSSPASARPGVVLSTGDIGILTPPSSNRGDSITVISGADLSTLVGWTRGELAFAGTPLGEVSARLERWYGVTFTIDPALGDRRVTASFTDRPLADVLAGICGALRARCDQQGANVTITSTTR